MKLTEILNADLSVIKAESNKLRERTEKLLGPGILFIVTSLICGALGVLVYDGMSDAPALLSHLSKVDVPSQLISRLSDVAKAAQETTSNLAEKAQFNDAVSILTSWGEGPLGKVIAMSMFLVSIAMGVVKQSPLAIMPGIAGAMMISYGPSVIKGIMGADTDIKQVAQGKSDKTLMGEYLSAGNWDAVLGLVQKAGSVQENAYVAAQVALIQKHPQLLNTNVERLRDIEDSGVFSREVVYVLEKAVFGHAASPIAVKYEKDMITAWSKSKQRGQLAMMLGEAMMIIGVGFVLVHAGMRRRVARIESLLSTLIANATTDDSSELDSEAQAA